MHKSVLIFKRDIERLIHNRVAMIVMIGVCILPSLYAWFNIAANMDPYSNTQGIKVAVADNDCGSKNDLLSLNAGEQIVENLKENNQLGWVFVTESEAIKGVKAGTYYAAIVIPEDFSDSLVSVISGEPERPELSYYINEKKNAIAPKITDTGAGTIQQEINDTFSSIAAETVSKLIQDSVTKISGDMSSMNTDVMAMLSEVQNNLNQYQTAQVSFQTTVGDSSVLIDNTFASLEEVKKAAGAGTDTFDDLSSLLNQSRGNIGTFTSAFSGKISDSEIRLGQIYGSASEVFEKVSSKAETVNSTVETSIASVENLMELNNRILEKLQQDTTILPEESAKKVSEVIASIQGQNAQYQTMLDQLKKENTSMGDALDAVKNTKTQLDTQITKSKETLQGYRNTMDQTLLPKLNQSLDSFSTLNGTLSATLSNVSLSTDQLKEILNQLKTCLSSSCEALAGTGEGIASLEGQLTDVSADLQALQSSEMYRQFLSLKGIDGDAIAEFMASPITIKSETLYSVKNYGSSMTPFYTNLALWVGGIILVAILKLEVDRDEKVRNFSATNAYFGRWLLFIAAGVIQGLIVCLGDLWILKVQCLHPAAFILTGVFCSFIYVNLIYALSAALKHIGKALCVVLVILQIPGSAGTYPIEMTPVFFQKLHPLLPFTYGINAMREAIAGMYGQTYLKNMACLLLFLPIALLIGVGIKVLLQNFNYVFDKKLGETDLMICETQGTKREKGQLSLVLKTLMKDTAMREDVTAKAAAFEAKYQRRIRMGFITIIVLPLLFLVLMFSIESKIVFLVLWIVSIIVIAGYLIGLEYIHDRLGRQMELGRLTEVELLRALQKGADE